MSGGSAADGSRQLRVGPHHDQGRDRVIAGRGNDRIRARDGRQGRISCGSGRAQVIADEQDLLTSCERVTRR